MNETTRKKIKAQMSLEMIMGLLILLVVAVVIISIFLNTFRKELVPSRQIDEVLRRKKFISECEGYCSEYLSSGNVAQLSYYCSSKFNGRDINGNGIIDKIKADTKVLDICEDSIYCFHKVQCESDNNIIDWSDCRNIVCNAQYDAYKNWTKANEKVKDLFPNAGSCYIPPEDNWWNMYFGDNPCLQG